MKGPCTPALKIVLWVGVVFFVIGVVILSWNNFRSWTFSGNANNPISMRMGELYYLEIPHSGSIHGVFKTDSSNFDLAAPDGVIFRASYVEKEGMYVLEKDLYQGKWALRTYPALVTLSSEDAFEIRYYRGAFLKIMNELAYIGLGLFALLMFVIFGGLLLELVFEHISSRRSRKKTFTTG